MKPPPCIVVALLLGALLTACGEEAPEAVTPRRLPPAQRPKKPAPRPIPTPDAATLDLRNLQLHGDGPDDMVRLLAEDAALPDDVVQAHAKQDWAAFATALEAAELAQRLEASGLYWSLRADALGRAGRREDARAAIQRALPLAGERSHAIYHTWKRARTLGLEPRESDADTVLGVAMEVGYAEGLLFVVAWADGGASLYLGSGGGVVGGQAHAPVRAAAARVTSVAETVLLEFERVQKHPLPSVGEVRFTALTPAGPRSATAPEHVLKRGEVLLAPVFAATHRLITQLRLVSEADK